MKTRMPILFFILTVGFNIPTAFHHKLKKAGMTQSM